MRKTALLLVSLQILLSACNGGSGSRSSAASGSGTSLAQSPPDFDQVPLISGTSSWVDGAFVWTDYVYDDHGANTDGRPGGDGVGGYSVSNANSADIVQLRLFRAADSWTAAFVLQTLTDPQLPVLGLAIDDDANTGTGAANLPGAEWQALNPMGIEWLLIARDSMLQVHEYKNEQWQLRQTLELEIDLEANTVALTVPEQLIATGSASWRVFGVAGFTNAAGQSWPEGGAIMDLAFVGGERPYVLQSAKQGDILASRLDSAGAAALVNWDIAVAGNTSLAQLPRGGFATLLHRSALNLPEGVREAGGTIAGLEYLGPYQPYLVWMPASLPQRAPLHVFLHGASQNHLGDTWVNLDGWPYHGLTPGLVGGYAGNNKPVGTDPEDVYLPNDGAVGSIVHIAREFVPYNAPGVVIFPLGRMNSSGYSGIFEADVFEAVADIKARISIDEDRISLSGSSMGGIGSFRLGALYPDVWSHVFPIIGDGSDVLPLLGNLYNLPVRMHNGLFDPLVSQPGPSDSANALAENDVDHRYWLFETREHESLFPINHCVRTEAFQARRQAAPADVRYTLLSSQQEEDEERGFSHLYDNAYWLSDIRLSPGRVRGDIRAINLSDPLRERSTVPISALRENISTGRDECGPNPDVRTFDIWSETGLEVSAQHAGDSRNGIALNLNGISGLIANLDEIAINTESVVVSINNDEPLLLGLRSGNWPETVSLYQGDQFLKSLQAEGGLLTIEVVAGSTEFRLVR